eukprot:2763036-Alexandrium_andersonii.AAC.1
MESQPAAPLGSPPGPPAAGLPCAFVAGRGHHFHRSRPSVPDPGWTPTAAKASGVAPIAPAAAAGS